MSSCVTHIGEFAEVELSRAGFKLDVWRQVDELRGGG